MKEVKIFIKDNGNREFETMRDLIQQIEQDRQWYKENDSEEKFLDSPILLQLSDYEGQIIEGKMHMSVGSMEDDTFLLVANVDNILVELKDEEEIDDELLPCGCCSCCGCSCGDEE